MPLDFTLFKPVTAPVVKRGRLDMTKFAGAMPWNRSYVQRVFVPRQSTIGTGVSTSTWQKTLLPKQETPPLLTTGGQEWRRAASEHPQSIQALGKSLSDLWNSPAPGKETVRVYPMSEAYEIKHDPATGQAYQEIPFEKLDWGTQALNSKGWRLLGDTLVFLIMGVEALKHNWVARVRQEVKDAADGLQARIAAAGPDSVVMPESKSYTELVSAVVKAGRMPNDTTIGRTLTNYAAALRSAKVVPAASAGMNALPTSAITQLSQALANPTAVALSAEFVQTLSPAVSQQLATLGVHVGKPAAEEPQVAAEPYVPRDKYQVEHGLLEVTQPAVPGVQTTKSMSQILAEEEALGARLDITPRAVDHSIPAIDITKAGLVDVTNRVDLASVQKQFPTADRVMLDTKRRVVMFMHDTTPLNAMAVDKPQLRAWYGINGEKLLSEVTQPAAVGAEIAPTVQPIAEQNAGVVPPTLKTPPKLEISKTRVSVPTTPAVSLRGGVETGAGVQETVKWGKWIEAVGKRQTSGVGTGVVETIKTPVTYRLGSGEVNFRKVSGSNMQLWETQKGKPLQLKDDPHAYYLSQVQHENPNYKSFVVTEGRSGLLIGRGGMVKDAIGNAQETILAHKAELDAVIGGAVKKHLGEANPAALPSSTPMTVSVANRARIDYARIVPSGTTSVTAPEVLVSAGNVGKGFSNYVVSTNGTAPEAHSLLTKLKEARDSMTRTFINQFDGLMTTPKGQGAMAQAVNANQVYLDMSIQPFYIDDAGNKVLVEGAFAPTLLSGYLKQYGPDFGKFGQYLQRASIPLETTKGVEVARAALAKQNIADAQASLANFQKNQPQEFETFMAAWQEIAAANGRILPELAKQFITPNTYKLWRGGGSPYYTSLSAGKTDTFDREAVAPLERARGLTNLEQVVDPLEGLKAVYLDTIRAQGINDAKLEAVRSHPSEIAATKLSDSIVAVKESGVESFYDVHDRNVKESVMNLSRSKEHLPLLVEWALKAQATFIRLFATGLNWAFAPFNLVRDLTQTQGTIPLTGKGIVRGVARAVKHPGLAQWFGSYRNPLEPTHIKGIQVVQAVLKVLSYPSEVIEATPRSITAESVLSRGGSYRDQLYAYFASSGYFALHGTFFKDWIANSIPFTRATIAAIRAAYRNAFYGLPIGGKGGTFSGKQGGEKIGGRVLAVIAFALLSILGIKESGKEKEYKLLRDRAKNFYYPLPSGDWVKLPVPIGFAAVRAAVDAAFGYESDFWDVARQTMDFMPQLDELMSQPEVSTYLQFTLNTNFFTGAPIVTKPDTPAKNILEAALMKLGMKEEQAVFLIRQFMSDMPQQVEYVIDLIRSGTSDQAFPLAKRFIAKDPTKNSNAAVDDFYTLVDAANMSGNAVLKRFVNSQASVIGAFIHRAKETPADAEAYMTAATDRIILTFLAIANNPDAYGIKKFGQYSWRQGSNYEGPNP